MSNVLFYCEQIYGTGHFSRTINIIEAILEKNTDTEIYLIFGGKIPAGRCIPREVKFLNIDDNFPSSKSESLLVNTKELTAKRFNLIHEFISKIRSLDSLYIEFFPFGRCHLGTFFRYTIDICRSWFPNITVTSFIRDVMDIHKKNRDKNIYDAIRYIDNIVVCGEREKNEVFFAAPEFKILEPILEYVGYVVPTALFRNNVYISSLKKGKNLLISAGGGEDGNDFIEELSDLLSDKYWIDEFDEINIFLSSSTNGNQCSKNLEQLNLKNINFHKYSREYLTYLAESEIHICMGGYNTIFESIAYDIGLVVVPRLWESEQKIRMEYLSSYYKCSFITERPVSSDALKSSVRSVRSNKCNASNNFNLMGAYNIAEKFLNNKNSEMKFKKIRLLRNIFFLIASDEFPGYRKISNFIKMAEQLVASIKWSPNEANYLLSEANNREMFFLMKAILPDFIESTDSYSIEEFKLTRNWYRALSLLSRRDIFEFRESMTSMDSLLYYEAVSALSKNGIRNN